MTTFDAKAAPTDERIGTRRRLALRDVLDYRASRRRRQLDAITATSADLEDDTDADLELLRSVRHALWSGDATK